MFALAAAIVFISIHLFKVHDPTLWRDIGLALFAMHFVVTVGLPWTIGRRHPPQ